MSLQVGAVVVAAGESRRMGTPKQLLPWGETTVLGSVVETILQSDVSEVVIVLGHEAEKVSGALRDGTRAQPRVRIVVNPDYRSGMLSSVRFGVESLGGDPAGFLTALSDQPGISPSVIKTLLDAFRRHPQRIVIPTYNGRRGHPVIFSLDLRRELEALSPDVGLRQLVWNHPELIMELPVDGQGILVDLDTPEEYQRYRPST
jgi:molybdenum cofactor cytidylyltransferase